MTHGGGVKMNGIDDSWKRMFLAFTNYDMRQYLGKGLLEKKITTYDYRASRLQKASCTGPKWIEVGHLILHRYILHSIDFTGSESLFL
jgi:hypothetical protein